ncbi:hypothetical protein DS906_01255 [Ruegeria sp. A3M17]|nr:hypothetical protein DS906_01255 [Ruegeria sp. A3M17]
MMKVLLSKRKSYLVILAGFSLISVLNWYKGFDRPYDAFVGGVLACILFFAADLVLSKYEKPGLDVLLYILVFATWTAYWLRPQ